MCRHTYHQLRVVAALNDRLVHGQTPKLPENISDLVGDYAAALYLLQVFVNASVHEYQVSVAEVLSIITPEESDGCDSAGN